MKKNTIPTKSTLLTSDSVKDKEAMNKIIEETIGNNQDVTMLSLIMEKHVPTIVEKYKKYKNDKNKNIKNFIETCYEKIEKAIVPSDYDDIISKLQTEISPDVEEKTLKSLYSCIRSATMECLQKIHSLVSNESSDAKVQNYLDNAKNKIMNLSKICPLDQNKTEELYAVYVKILITLFDNSLKKNNNNEKAIHYQVQIKAFLNAPNFSESIKKSLEMRFKLNKKFFPEEMEKTFEEKISKENVEITEVEVKTIKYATIDEIVFAMRNENFSLFDKYQRNPVEFRKEADALIKAMNTVEPTENSKWNAANITKAIRGLKGVPEQEILELLVALTARVTESPAKLDEMQYRSTCQSLQAMNSKFPEVACLLKALEDKVEVIKQNFAPQHENRVSRRSTKKADIESLRNWQIRLNYDNSGPFSPPVSSVPGKNENDKQDSNENLINLKRGFPS